MANEKIFVGELGAKEMYRRLKGIIPSAWKDWSEQHDSVGTDGAIYIGQNNNLNRTWSFGFGNYNTTSSTILADWSGSDVVMVGSYNNAIDAAGAYQIGFHNTVRNNHRMLIDAPTYNYYTAINFGNGNTIDAEGMNLGKDNTAADFGMNLGQHNSANHASLSIGERVSTNQASISIGTNSIAENKSLSIGFGSVIAGVLYEAGEFLHSGEYGSSLAIGLNNVCATKNSIAIGFGTTTADAYSVISGGSFGIIADGTGINGSPTSIEGNSFGVGTSLSLQGGSFSIGRFNTAAHRSYAFGDTNTVTAASFAIGQNNQNIGSMDAPDGGWGYAFAVGRDLNDVRGKSCTFGIANTHINRYAYSSGMGNDTVYEGAVAVGIENRTVYYHSTAVGSHNYDIHGDGVAVGNGNHGIRDMGTAVGSYNFDVYYGSFAAGEANTAQNGSISVGISNYGRSGAILLGIGNKATASPSDSYYISYHANSVVMGFGNEVYNVREVLKKSGWTKSITTCGMAIGSYIKAYGHNFISIGSSNTLGDVDNWMNDTATNTDNDGFMTAIGFKCTAKRNYDFAYGYQSVANGGENIAFQHSTATGYRNIAMIDSTLTDCTANIALCESSLTLSNISSPKLNVVHNTLLHSQISVELGSLSNNVLLHTNGNIETSAANGIHRNIIMVGTQHHPLALSAGALTNNLIYGFRSGYFIAKNFDEYNGTVALASSSSFDRNLLFNNAYGSFSALTFNDNIINTSELSVESSSFFNDNIINDSLISVNRSTCNVVSNFIIGKSKIDIQLDATEVTDNFLMYSYLGDNNNGNPIITGEVSSGGFTTYMTHNFLYGTNAYHTQATVSFATPHYSQSPECAYYDPTYTGQYLYTAKLIDCCNVFNFGDNIVKGVNFEFVFGNGHNVHSSKVGFVYGTGNETAYTTGSIVMGERNSVIGTRKKSEGEVTHTVILGSNNLVKAACETEYNMIFGTNNSIVGSFNTVTKTTAQIASLPTNVKEYIKVNADCIRPKSSSIVYYIYKNTYCYLYSNGCLYQNSGIPSGRTIVDAGTTSNLASMYLNRQMTEGTWYKATSGSSYQVNASSGSWLEPGHVYYHYNDTLSDLGICNDSSNNISIYNSNNRILGISNTIYDHVMNYTVVGSANSVKCDDFTDQYDYAISSGFVQGNNNVASNGSNIISMGNGNVSTGHNSVAIGNQLISHQWQTVIGKYNKEIEGPNRLASETPQDSSKALFIVGNGYSSRDDSYWQDEQYITRSNALELYANGNLKLAGSVDTAFVLANNGITSLGPINVPQNIITAKNLPAAPSENGQYTLNCTVNDGTVTYDWVKVEFTTVS